MKKAIVLASIVAGIALSGAAWACEDGPECQDPYAAAPVAKETESSRSPSPQIAHAQYLPPSGAERARAEAPAPTAQP